MSSATCWCHLVLLSMLRLHWMHPATCSPTWMSRQFGCDVRTSNSNILFDCQGRGLRRVPVGITPNATVLNLSENQIQNLTADMFVNLGNLLHLNLNWANKKGELKIIDQNVFRPLTKLRDLRLSGNCLTGVPRNLPAGLQTLSLNTNRIIRLDNRSFAGVTNITKLSISKNCYFWNKCGKPMTVKDDSFSALTQLQFLEVSFNNLTHVPRGLPKSLESLNLGSNKIQYISQDDFQGLPQLKNLEIQGNCPRCENAPYPCYPCPNISLGIHAHAFSGLKQLQLLHLGGNSLRTLDDSWFESLGNLKYLYLSFNLLNNAIVGEVKFLHNLHSLEKMDLSFNFGHKSYPLTIKLSDAFSKLRSLSTLHMPGIVFKEIKPDTLRPLYALKNLTVLNLGTNFIVRANSSIFLNLSHVKLIYLAENRLYPVSVNNAADPGRDENTKPRHFIPPPLGSYTNDFKYEIFQMKQECFDSGRVLSLTSNNLFFITPEQFEGYGDIACLNLSKNGFSAALNGTEFSSLPNLTYLDLSFNKVDLAYDNAFKELQRLEVLDLSHNEHYFKAYGVTHNLNFLRNLPALRVLNMSDNHISTLSYKQMWSASLQELQFRGNQLGVLWKENDGSYVRLFTNLTNLTILDISDNNMAKIPTNVYGHLPRNLTTLRLSRNTLTNFGWQQLSNFDRLQILDLSFNFLTHVPAIISEYTNTLRTLDLSHNHISHLSDGFLKGATELKTLFLSHNNLMLINQTTFLSKADNYMETLFLDANPFHCTCDLLDFILWIEGNDVSIPQLTTAVKCGTPSNRKGQILIFFDIDQCVNDALAFLFCTFSSTLIVLIMLMATVAHLFYWDVSYVLHYLKAKMKGYHALSATNNIYDVFVMYDTSDSRVSEWVMERLLVQLEDEGERERLCLGERDWPPGVPLVDNLTQSIRYSRKTLFVLTESYVRTGAFRLAMYLAHQRLLDENLDVIVVLMLEPVLQHSHFLRLRRRLCWRSVVEWPRTAAAEPWFWQNLRHVVRVDNQVLYTKTYSKYFHQRMQKKPQHVESRNVGPL